MTNKDKQFLKDFLKTPDGVELFKKICEDVFDRKMKERQVYVKAINKVGDMPALYIKLQDTEKIVDSKTFNKVLKSLK